MIYKTLALYGCSALVGSVTNSYFAGVSPASIIVGLALGLALAVNVVGFHFARKNRRSHEQ
jgi:F0F1-type ATP synthase assembly protein I